MNGKKYIQCTHKGMVTCKLKNKNGEEQSFVFYPFIMNKYTGQPEHTGFSTLDAADYDRLAKESNLFKSFMSQGLLTVSDTLPASAQTVVDLMADRDQQIAKLTDQVAQLEAEVKTLEAAADKGGLTKKDITAAVKAADDKSALLVAELAKTHAEEIENKDATISALEKDVDDWAAHAEILVKFIEEKGFEAPEMGVETPAKF